MSDIHQQILNTEQALSSILDELKHLQSAASQIDKAKDMSQKAIQASEEINLKTRELLRASEALLRYIEQSRISEELTKISAQNVFFQENVTNISEGLERLGQDNHILNDTLLESVNNVKKEVSKIDIYLNAQSKVVETQNKVLEDNISKVSDQLKTLENFVNQATEREEKAFIDINNLVLKNRKFYVIFGSIVLFGLIVNIVILLIRH